MRRPNLRGRSYLVGAVGGLFIGLELIHPLSMVFQGAVHPALSIDYSRILKAFNPHHIPMAIFFAVLGGATGILIIRFQQTLALERQRVEALVSILPICSYCRKIRDDSGKPAGTGDWLTLEEYFAQKTDMDLSHGICSDCYQKVLAEIGELAGDEASSKGRLSGCRCPLPTDT